MSGYQNTSSSATKRQKYPHRRRRRRLETDPFALFQRERIRRVLLFVLSGGSKSDRVERRRKWRRVGRVREVRTRARGVSILSKGRKGLQHKRLFLVHRRRSFRTQHQCEQFSENDVLFSPSNAISEDEKIEKGADYCFAFCEGKVSDTEVKVRLFSPLTMGC